MLLYDQLIDDLNKALKERNIFVLENLRFLKAALMNYRIDKRLENLSDDDVIKVIKNEIKKRQDSVEAYEKGGRVDLADKEKQEILLLQKYLPESLSRESLQKIIEEKLKDKTGLTNKDFGPLMGVLIKELGTKVDNKMLAEVLKEKLGG